MLERESVNILLVDDKPENLLALEAIIEKSDYNIHKASSGEEALVQLLKYEFAVILLDVQMPGVDGFETAKIIKARERTKHVPIIFITANNIDSKHIFLGYSVGAIDYILKPFDPFILKSKVDIFVELYMTNQKNIHQAEILMEKTKELERANLELTRKTSQLLESEALANVISETSIDSMIIMDHAGIILKVNPAFTHIFLYEPEEILGKSITLLFSDEKSKIYVQHILEAIHSIKDNSLNELSAIRRDETTFFVEIQVGKRYVKNKCILACTLRDITKRKQDQEVISYMAYHDGLTKLPNRRQFNDRLHVLLKKAKENHFPFSILYLDIDRFKFINDSLGHFIGDQLLQKFAQRLFGYIRKNDFVARLGGDEFIILMTDTSSEKAVEMAESIIESLKQPFYLEKNEIIATASIGISIFPYDGEDTLELMKNADAALYRAKEQGKNMVKIFHSGMNIYSYKSFVLQNELRKAIERNELTLHYQPRLDIETGSINSAEVLVRWNHPDWGVIFPSEFIPLAEETGQIIEIGEWVLRTACEQMKAWKKNEFHPIRLAVNFAPRQFLQKDILETIRSILSETDISPELLEIEITESTLMENEVRIVQVLNEIKSLGITISIDDFGKGYSSLSHLRKLPVQTLKIDKSFIQDMSTTDPESIALVSSILSLGQSLSMSVIAEGVETEEQLKLLKGNHCKEIQGYFLTPPIPISEFETFIKNWSEHPINLLTEMEPLSILNTTIEMNSKDKELEKKDGILDLALSRARKMFSISARENDVFKLMVEGLSNKEISETLVISEHTVKNHITRIFQKLEVSDRIQAMAIIYQICLEESQKLAYK